jgi:hydroxyethylthiazole kinase
MPAEGDEMHSPREAGAVAKKSAAVLTRLREGAPRVHCITNSVAQNFTANVLLAAGALPSMTISAAEIADFVLSADALLVNLGTLDSERSKAIEIAIREANTGKLPWVLDPVLIDRTRPRATLARQLLEHGPAAVRLNAAEFRVLSSSPASSGDDVAAFAARSKAVIALSGPTDLVTDGERAATIANGHEWMGKVTAMGCAASALLAACLAVEPDRFDAAAAAMLILGVAGEIAAQEANGPGSFAAAILDALHKLDGDALLQKARVTS